MAVTVERTAYSPVIYEGHDFVCGILDREGNLVSGTTGLPIFLGNLSSAVRDSNATIGLQNLEPGDVVFCNDPYMGGGTHGNDIVAMLPIHRESSLMGFVAFKGHTLDMGGGRAGGNYNDTTEIYQELLRVPPVKLYRKGEVDTDLLRLITLNTRTPEFLAGDIRSMVAALRTGASSVINLIERYSPESYETYVEAIFDHADRLTREEIRKIPSGAYSAEYFLDGDGDDGSPLSRKLRLAMKIQLKDESMVIDMSDSSPQSKGPMNSPRACSISHLQYGFKSITTPQLSMNDGSFRALQIILKPGTLLDPIPPAACSCWVEASMGLTDLLLRTLAPAIPNRVRASSFGSDLANAWSGVDPRTNRLYVFAEPSAPGGWGAKPTEDGETMFSTDEGNSFYPMVEVFEVLYPMLVRRFELIPDSGGPGKFRGGLGVAREVTPVGHEALVGLAFERQLYSPPWGLFGGKDGKGNFVTITRRNGIVEKHEKITGYPLGDGESILYESGGGGGYGDPLERDEDRVLRDVLDGYVSVASARDDYGVIVDFTNEKVNFEATRRLRNEMQTCQAQSRS
jgi:N-methylhydantoinase B